MVHLTAESSANLSPFPSASWAPAQTTFEAGVSRPYLSMTLSSAIGCVVPIIALGYFGIVSWMYKFSLNRPKVLNKHSGIRLQRYAPLVYVYLVVSSLVVVSLTSWLLLQYRFLQNYPNDQMRTGARLLLFSSCWTALTAGFYTVLFLHTSWSRLMLASVGSQTIWVFVTWLFWIVGTGLVNGAVPSLLAKGQCYELVYCGQIQALFAMSVIQSLILTGCLLTLAWLILQMVQAVFRKESVAVPRSPEVGMH